jgi:hypothetical protein
MERGHAALHDEANALRNRRKHGAVGSIADTFIGHDTPNRIVDCADGHQYVFTPHHPDQAPSQGLE